MPRHRRHNRPHVSHPPRPRTRQEPEMSPYIEITGNIVVHHEDRTTTDES